MKGLCIMSEIKKDREGEEQDNPELFKTEIDYHRYWKDMYEKEHKLRQEAETESILVKGIGMNSPEMRTMKTKLRETEVILNGTKKIVEDGFHKIQEMQKELDRVKKEKTIGQLAKEYPDKTYKDLERYRDEDRAQEAGVCVIGEARKDREGEEQDNPVLFEKEIDYHRHWKDMYEKEHKLRQEAEGETTIVKGIGINSPEMKKAKERIAELNNSLAIALEINESHQRYNGKLQTRLTELEEENKKLNNHLNKRIDNVRKSGM